MWYEAKRRCFSNINEGPLCIPLGFMTATNVSIASESQQVPDDQDQRGARPVPSRVQRPVRRVQGAPLRGAEDRPQV